MYGSERPGSLPPTTLLSLEVSLEEWQNERVDGVDAKRAVFEKIRPEVT